MTKYYEQHPFPNKEARERAQYVATRLFNGHRFFPCDPYVGDPSADHGHGLDPNVFGEITQGYADLKAVYQKAKQDATDAIREAETASGVTAARLRNGQKAVECRCYGGGATLCRIYPLTAFIETAPTSVTEIRDELFADQMGDKSDDDISPKQHRSYEEWADKRSSEIWGALQAVDHLNPENHRCLVMMQPSFNLGDYGKLLCKGVLTKWQEHAVAAGCLVYNYSQVHRVVRRSAMIFSTVREDHTIMHHESGKEPRISYHTGGGYDYSPMFATIQ